MDDSDTTGASVSIGHTAQRTRTADVLGDTDIIFSSLLLAEPVLRGLTDAGFNAPSPIQLKAIPLGRCGIDLIAQAKSGTGKTCVFSVIALERVKASLKAAQCLVLAPTREIAAQIHHVMETIGKHTGVVCRLFIGGFALSKDIPRCKDCHIIIGSPGRVWELIDREHLDVSSVRMFILDEADKLLSYNFRQQTNAVFWRLPERKQVLAFSATYPQDVVDSLNGYMQDPTRVRLNEDAPSLVGVNQFTLDLGKDRPMHELYEAKADALLSTLERINFRQCLVFTKYRTRALSLADTLVEAGWPAASICGAQDQQDRLDKLKQLREFQLRVLVSTDVIARGIDIERVNLVINLDIPLDGETYLHRIGRSGRFGTKGISVTFVTTEETKTFLAMLEKYNTTATPLPVEIPESLYEYDNAEDLQSITNVEVKQLRKKKDKLKNAAKKTSKRQGNKQDPVKAEQAITDAVSNDHSNNNGQRRSDNSLPVGEEPYLDIIYGNRNNPSSQEITDIVWDCYDKSNVLFRSVYTPDTDIQYSPLADSLYKNPDSECRDILCGYT